MRTLLVQAIDDSSLQLLINICQKKLKVKEKQKNKSNRSLSLSLGFQTVEKSTRCPKGKSKEEEKNIQEEDVESSREEALIFTMEVLADDLRLRLSKQSFPQRWS